MPPVIDRLYLFIHMSPILIRLILSLLRQKTLALLHRHTYILVPPSRLKTVLVVGGSFTGIQLARRLAQTLPTGHRVVLVEKNSHLHFLFAFPRLCVVGGYDRYAFIPYDGIGARDPRGVFEYVQGEVQSVDGGNVVLRDGRQIGFEVLVLATGTRAGVPSKVLSTERLGGMGELEALRGRIGEAESIAVVGGGAVGVQLASDVKDVYPGKEVVLVHSREQLMVGFGPRLHDYAMGRFRELGVRVLLGERPRIPFQGEEMMLQFKDGTAEKFDLIIPCTGQRPNSEILKTFAPEAISPQTGRILVRPTMQLQATEHSNVFAIGDVAETTGPKMARAGFFQAEIIVSNMLSLIAGKTPLKTYEPNAFEGSIKLTLGKSHAVIYMMTKKGREILIPTNSGLIDLGVSKSWPFFGADVRSLEDEVEEDAKLEVEA